MINLQKPTFVIVFSTFIMVSVPHKEKIVVMTSSVVNPVFSSLSTLSSPVNWHPSPPHLSPSCLPRPGLVQTQFTMSAMRVDAKVVMLGKESVGKTSLVERYVHHRFLVGPYQNVSVSCSASISMSPVADSLAASRLDERHHFYI